MRTLVQRILLLMIMATAMSPTAYAFESSTRVWSFDDDQPEALPPEFQVGTLFDGRPAGDWKVLHADQANSPPNVLGQMMGKGAEHAYKTVFINGTQASDIELQVAFLPIDGKADMGGGLIWRATDDRNYYLTRANPLEQNVRIYRVVKGVRHMLKNFDRTIDIRHWHQLRVIHRGCQIQVFYDGTQVFHLCDKTFTQGMVGLWTKSDAVTYFDNLQLQSLK
jgi:hypothetical protein